MPLDDLRALYRWGLLHRAWGVDLYEAAAPWAGEE